MFERNVSPVTRPHSHLYRHGIMFKEVFGQWKNKTKERSVPREGTLQKLLKKYCPRTNKDTFTMRMCLAYSIKCCQHLCVLFYQLQT